MDEMKSRATHQLAKAFIEDYCKDKGIKSPGVVHGNCLSGNFGFWLLGGLPGKHERSEIAQMLREKVGSSGSMGLVNFIKERWGLLNSTGYSITFIKVVPIETIIEKMRVDVHPFKGGDVQTLSCIDLALLEK